MKSKSKGGDFIIEKINKADLERLRVSERGWKCIEPFLISVRGKDTETKLAVYKQLNRGQQALYMFYAYFNHAKNSLEEFYWWSQFFQGQPSSWQAIKGSLHYFGLIEMLTIFDETGEMLTKIKKHYNREVSFKELTEDGASSLEDISRLFTSYTAYSEKSLLAIGEYVSNHSTEFIQISTVQLGDE
ncbi:hypothetical protein ACLM5H_04140 [Fredinandcohnia humi]